MARYWVLVSHELMRSDDLQWPHGLRPVKQAEDGPGPSADCAWWLFEDDSAPAELEGRRVELEFGASYDEGGKTPVITDRRVMT